MTSCYECQKPYSFAVNGVSHDAYTAPVRARFKGVALGFPAGRAASPEGEVPQALIPRRSRFGIETANQGGSEEAKVQSCQLTHNSSSVRATSAPGLTRTCVNTRAISPITARTQLSAHHLHVGYCPHL